MTKEEIKAIEREYLKEKETTDLQLVIAKANTAIIEIKSKIRENEINILKQKAHIDLQHEVVNNAENKLKSLTIGEQNE